MLEAPLHTVEKDCSISAGLLGYSPNSVEPELPSPEDDATLGHMPTPVHGVEGLKQLVGVDLGFTPYRTISQERIDTFADATDDHQWIHVDTEAAKKGPFGTTIAHGFLTLSLVSAMLPEVLSVDGVSMGVNYGANRVRFPSPVPVDSRVRLGATVAEVTDVAGGVQVQVNVTIEVEGAPKPSMVAEILFRYYS